MKSRAVHAASQESVAQQCRDGGFGGNRGDRWSGKPGDNDDDRAWLHHHQATSAASAAGPGRGRRARGGGAPADDEAGGDALDNSAGATLARLCFPIALCVPSLNVFFSRTQM